jgi:hypothetical protein
MLKPEALRFPYTIGKNLPDYKRHIPEENIFLTDSRSMSFSSVHPCK